MLDWFRKRGTVRAIPDPLWRGVLRRYPFLAALPQDEQARLRELAAHFLASKEFHGAQGFVITDEVALSIAAQAVLPVLNLGLQWYDDFVGIVVHREQVLARRIATDESGVVHQWDEVLVGEAMDRGPVMLSWRDVEESGVTAPQGYNVVIHEFAHVLDMRDGQADGVPPLPDRAAHDAWLQVLSDEFDAFCERVDNAQVTLLDPYGAQGPEELFAVAAEAFFVAPLGFQTEHPRLYTLLKGFFQQDPAAHTTP